MSQILLQLGQGTNIDLSIPAKRTLNATVPFYYKSGTTGNYVDAPFDFTAYSGACMTVKNADKVLLTFDTSDGSLVIGSGNTITFKKTAAELANIRPQEGTYDMYLRGITADIAKRDFLYGKFIIEQRLTT